MVWPLFNGYNATSEAKSCVISFKSHPTIAGDIPNSHPSVIQAFPLAHLIPTHVNVSSISISILWLKIANQDILSHGLNDLEQNPTGITMHHCDNGLGDAKKPSNENMHSLPAFLDSAGLFFSLQKIHEF